jgi:hypothetical protein
MLKEIQKASAHSTQHHAPQQFQSFFPGCTLFAGIDAGAVSNHIPKQAFGLCKQK